MADERPQKGRKGMAALHLALWAGLAAWVNYVYIYAQRSYFKVDSDTDPMGMSFIISAFLGLMILMFIVSLFAMISRKNRRNASIIAAYTLVWVLVGFISMGYALKVRKDGIIRVIEESAPLVEAIYEYETVEGAPPESLENLVPGYLEQIPVPTVYHHEYRYQRSENGDNKWLLSLSLLALHTDWRYVVYRGNAAEEIDPEVFVFSEKNGWYVTYKMPRLEQSRRRITPVFNE